MRDSQGKPDWTLLAVKGTTYIYCYKSKKLMVGPTPPELLGEKGPARKGFLDTMVGDIAEHEAWLLRGLPVADYNKRFHVRLEKEDTYWIYLGFHPRKDSGRRSDDTWQIVLDRKTYRIRRIWRQMSNGKTTQVDFEHIPCESLPAKTWEPPFRKVPESWIEADWSKLPTDVRRLAVPREDGKDRDK